MAQRQRNNNTRRVNWLQIFQGVNSSWGRIAVIAAIMSLGYTFGFFSCQFIKDRELLQKEEQFNTLSSQYSKELNEFERSKSDQHLENNQLKSVIFNLRDSIRKNEKR
jgi:hypothetical protein